MKKRIKDIHKNLRPLKKKTKDEKKPKSDPKKLYYIFLTFILGICLFQAVRGASLNLFKFLTLNKQYSELVSINKDAKERNNDLKSQLDSYTSDKGIEALARNNLKMVGKNEVLVVIKKNQTPPPQKK